VTIIGGEVDGDDDGGGSIHGRGGRRFPLYPKEGGGERVGPTLGVKEKRGDNEATGWQSPSLAASALQLQQARSKKFPAKQTIRPAQPQTALGHVIHALKEL
jgi:hypothetical protein